MLPSLKPNLAIQMLSNTAPVQGLMVLLAGPYLDSLITQKWILTYLKAQDTYNSLDDECTHGLKKPSGINEIT